MLRTEDFQSLAWFSPDTGYTVGQLQSWLGVWSPCWLGFLKSFVLVVYIFILCVSVLCLSVHHRHAQCPQRPEEGAGFPEEGAIGGC